MPDSPPAVLPAWSYSAPAAPAVVNTPGKPAAPTAPGATFPAWASSSPDAPAVVNTPGKPAAPAAPGAAFPAWASSSPDAPAVVNTPGKPAAPAAPGAVIANHSPPVTPVAAHAHLGSGDAELIITAVSPGTDGNAILVSAQAILLGGQAATAEITEAGTVLIRIAPGYRMVVAGVAAPNAAANGTYAFAGQDIYGWALFAKTGGYLLALYPDFENDGPGLFLNQTLIAPVSALTDDGIGLTSGGTLAGGGTLTCETCASTHTAAQVAAAASASEAVSARVTVAAGGNGSGGVVPFSATLAGGAGLSPPVPVQP